FQFIGEVIEIVIRHTSRALQPFFDSIRNLLGTAWNFTVELAGKAWDWIIGTTWEEKWKDITSWLTAIYTWTIGIAGAAWNWITGTTWAEKMEKLKSWIAAAWE